MILGCDGKQEAEFNGAISIFAQSFPNAEARKFTIRVRGYNACELDRWMIERTLSEPKPNQQEHVSLKWESIAKYFPKKHSAAEIEQDILKGLELLKRHRERDRDAR